MSGGFLTPKRGAAAAIVVAALIQLVPVRRDNPPVVAEVEAPREVKAILERSCYDCHSNRTRWPWYSRVAPVSWLVAYDVREGRDELNFSDWPAYDLEKQDDLLKHITKQVERGKMPLPIYLTMHAGARLTVADRRVVLDWARLD